jgi:RNA polymerase sigma factor (sigma-70 family)
MSSFASGALAVSKTLDRLAREDRGRLLAALIARIKDFQLAEESLQDAMISAMSHWSRSGLPASPQGWLLQVAYRKSIDRIRQNRSAGKLQSDLQHLAGEEAYEPDMNEIPDERLRLIFTCCHPALERKSQVALTLRTLGGLSTEEIARAFLDQDSTMGQRLSRAKTKIASAGIPFAVPGPEEWAERLGAVLSVVYLIFNAGYSAGPGTGRDFSEEAIFLCRLIDRLRRNEAETEGCLALMLITHARRAARLDAAGMSIPVGAQDRGRWDGAMLAEGIGLIEKAMMRRAPGPYQIKAAIAACHCEGDTSDWRQIAALYDSLLNFEPTPVVRLNRAIAIAEAGAPEAGLRLAGALAAELSDYQPFHAAHADLLARCGRSEEARSAYETAIGMAASSADAMFLRARLAALGRGTSSVQ